MAKSRTSFKKGDSVPGRGRSFKNKLLDVISSESLIGANDKMSHAELETLYITHFARRAFDIDDAASPMLSKELLNKSYPSLKSTMPLVNFEFSVKATASEQANEIIKAASKGIIPPDVAQIFITSLASMMKIEEVTEIANRLTEIEKALGIGNA
tara:strand:+ start:3713 stop:4177 length:465 start_codon:yes stop_codon:yes gene_type:complete